MSMWIASIAYGDSTMTIEKQCVVCGEMKSVHCTEEQFWAWQNGALIQNAMPDTPKEERELLMSGICGECWQKEFHDEDED